MDSRLSTRQLSKELIARGLLPANCRIIEVRIEPSGPLVIRYEVFVTGKQLDLFADAMKAAAVDAIADDERNALARAATTDQPASP